MQMNHAQCPRSLPMESASCGDAKLRRETDLALGVDSRQEDSKDFVGIFDFLETIHEQGRPHFENCTTVLERLRLVIVAAKDDGIVVCRIKCLAIVGCLVQYIHEDRKSPFELFSFGKGIHGRVGEIANPKKPAPLAWSVVGLRV